MRDYTNIDSYLDELQAFDIYPQPDDEGHSIAAEEIIEKWSSHIIDAETVLDVGCGTGFCFEYFESLGKDYVGIRLGDNKINPLIFTMDFNFITFSDETFDLVFSRHSLEHSPFPLLSLMEWHRVAKKYLILVLPNPDHYTYIGRNHYSVMNKQQTKWILRRAGWELLSTDYSDKTELRFLCRKQPRVGYEGHVETLTTEIYERDRDE